MHVTDLEAIPVEMSVKQLSEERGLAPYVTGVGQMETAQRMLVRLETDAGITGWGEMLGEIHPRALQSILEDEIAPELVGRSVWEMEAFLDDFFYFYVDIGAALGAVEMAMWDCLGKELGSPVHKLIGGKDADTVSCSYCVGILDPDESRDHVNRALDMGFDVLKTKGGRDWRHDVERLVAMDDEADGRLDLRIDANQAWTFEDCVRAAAKLQDAGVYLQYLEQPVRIESVGTYKRLRERLQQPIAVNDDLYFDRNLHQLVREDAIDVGVVDLVPAGGITGLKKLAGIAEDAGISLAHHNGFDLGIKQAAVLHAVSSTPAINLAPDTVYYAWEDDVLETPFEVIDGELAVPDEPGLGVTVDEEKVEQYRIDV